MIFNIAFAVFAAFVQVVAGESCAFIWCSSKDGIPEKLAKLTEKVSLSEATLKEFQRNSTTNLREVKTTILFELEILQKTAEFYARKPNIKNNEKKHTCHKIILVKIDDFNVRKTLQCLVEMESKKFVEKQIAVVKDSIKNVEKACKQEPENNDCIKQKMASVEKGILEINNILKKEMKISKDKTDFCLKKELKRMEKLKTEYHSC